MTADIRGLANELLDVADELGVQVSNLSLQKLLFFAHADHLAAFGSPLTKNVFEAWRLGPVSPVLYHEFKSFGERPITARASAFDYETGRPVRVNDLAASKARPFLRQTLSVYGHLTARQLVALSHEPGTPWDRVWNNSSAHGLKGLEISERIIREAQRFV